MRETRSSALRPFSRPGRGQRFPRRMTFPPSCRKRRKIRGAFRGRTATLMTSPEHRRESRFPRPQANARRCAGIPARQEGRAAFASGSAPKADAAQAKPPPVSASGICRRSERRNAPTLPRNEEFGLRPAQSGEEMRRGPGQGARDGADAPNPPRRSPAEFRPRPRGNMCHPQKPGVPPRSNRA